MAWKHVGLCKTVGERPSDKAGIDDGYQAAPGKDGAWAITGVIDGKVLWTRWLKTKPKKKADPGSSTLPEWIRRRQVPPSVTRSEVVAAVVRCIGSITERPVDVNRCKGDADEVLKLWRGLSHPPLKEFVSEVALVASAARVCPDGLFAHDIRSEGREGKDRSRSVATLCVLRRWNERLDTARAWKEKQGLPVGPVETEDQVDEEPPPKMEY